MYSPGVVAVVGTDVKTGFSVAALASYGRTGITSNHYIS